MCMNETGKIITENTSRLIFLEITSEEIYEGLGVSKYKTIASNNIRKFKSFTIYKIRFKYESIYDPKYIRLNSYSNIYLFTPNF